MVLWFCAQAIKILRRKTLFSKYVPLELLISVMDITHDLQEPFFEHHALATNELISNVLSFFSARFSNYSKTGFYSSLWGICKATLSIEQFCLLPNFRGLTSVN